ncbi:MAG: hypothetical protein HKP55_10095, partial [Gammaproteobacteria bacterium]|nr:hypothetical protein [Gammaproteobacteria bacterium]
MTFIFIGLLISDYFRSIELINQNEKLHINIVKKALIRDLIDIGPDLKILIGSDQFKEYLKAPDNNNKKKLENTFSLFAEQRRIYAQIRFIDVEGWEKVRVDFNHSKVLSIADEQLQNKSDR